MDFRQEVTAFANAHQSRINQVLHLLSGLLYMTIILYLCGGYGAVFVYTIMVYVILPNPLMVSLMFTMLMIFQFTMQMVLKTSKTTYIRVTILSLVAIVSYCMPELGHMLTADKGIVLQGYTPHHIIRNMFTLLPYTLCLFP